jgi:hypothetical protein
VNICADWQTHSILAGNSRLFVGGAIFFALRRLRLRQKEDAMGCWIVADADAAITQRGSVDCFFLMISCLVFVASQLLPTLCFSRAPLLFSLFSLASNYVVTPAA